MRSVISIAPNHPNIFVPSFGGQDTQVLGSGDGRVKVEEAGEEERA